MSIIRSTTELIYDSRTQRCGIIEVEITDWKYQKKFNRYIAEVEDFLIETQTDESGNEFEKRTPIFSKPVPYSKDDINALFFALGNPIEITENYSDEMDMLIAMALLYVTQNDPIYGSTAINWVIV